MSAAALQAAMVASFADVFGLLVPVFADLPDGSWVQRRTVIRSLQTWFASRNAAFLAFQHIHRLVACDDRWSPCDTCC